MTRKSLLFIHDIAIVAAWTITSSVAWCYRQCKWGRP